MLLFLIACSAPAECYDACETVFATCWSIVGEESASSDDYVQACKDECEMVSEDAAVTFAEDVVLLYGAEVDGADSCAYFLINDNASPCPNGPRLEAPDPDAWTCE